MKTLRVTSKDALLRDLLTGAVIALLSIPLSMGYAQVAGLPPLYGLYGSLVALLVFGLLTSSPRVVFGVDAAPAALVGTLLPQLGIALGGEDAVGIMPLITLLTALWLLLIWLLRGGRFAKFISEPVLGGCVSAIAGIVILMQMPRLFGGSVTSGRAPTLLVHLIRELEHFHPLSFALGAATVAIVLYGRRRTKMSMSVVMTTAGILLSAVCHLDRYGVAVVGEIQPGLPRLINYDFSFLAGHEQELLLDTLAVALVISAETLVSTKEIGRKYGDDIDNQRELLAYAVSNLIASLCGSSPVCGSISRTRRANKREVSSQWMSVSAFAVLGLFLLFGVPVLKFLPIPVLTGIMIASLLNILEFSMAAHLWKVDRPRFFVFLAAFAAEMLGLAEGVLAGVVLSFASFTMYASMQPRDFLGCLEGEEGFFALSQTPHAKPIEHTLLYQFSGELFFANIDDFMDDLKKAMRPDVRLIVVSGLTSIDLVSAERLLSLYRELKEQGTAFFLAGHVSAVNEQLIAYGAEEIVHDGAVKSRFTEALAAGGLKPPYPLDRDENDAGVIGNAVLEKFTWAYGKYAGPRLERLARRMSEDIVASGGTLDLEKLNQAERELAGEYWNTADEEEFLDLLEMSLAVASVEQHESEERFRAMARELLERRIQMERQLSHRGDIAVAREFIQLRLKREADFLRHHPEAGNLLIEQREEYMAALRQEDPDLADLIEQLSR